MPNRGDIPTRRQADAKLEEILSGVKMLCGIFDIDICNPEKAEQASIEANKDIRFLRAFREGTSQSIRQARTLTIAGFFTGVGLLIMSIFQKH